MVVYKCLIRREMSGMAGKQWNCGAGVLCPTRVGRIGYWFSYNSYQNISCTNFNLFLYWNFKIQYALSIDIS